MIEVWDQDKPLVTGQDRDMSALRAIIQLLSWLVQITCTNVNDYDAGWTACLMYQLMYCSAVIRNLILLMKNDYYN